jgi:hypothetical protein
MESKHIVVFIVAMLAAGLVTQWLEHTEKMECLKHHAPKECSK